MHYLGTTMTTIFKIPLDVLTCVKFLDPHFSIIQLVANLARFYNIFDVNTQFMKK
jgi:hypothetical protein